MAGYTPQEYPQQPYPGPVAVGPPDSGMATAAMVLGIVGLFTCGLTSILAVIFGHVGLAQTNGGQRGGRGQAIAGLVIGYVVLAPGIVFVFLMIIGAISAPLGTLSTQ